MSNDNTKLRRPARTIRILGPLKRRVRDRLTRLIDDRAARLVTDRLKPIEDRLLELERSCAEANRLTLENTKAIEWILHENMATKRDLGWLVESGPNESSLVD